MGLAHRGRLGGGLTGKLAVQGIQGTLAFAHTHAFIPLFTLDRPLTALFLSGRLNSTFHRCHLFIVSNSLLCLHTFSLLISLIEYCFFEQSIFQLLSLPYLICASVLIINYSLIHLANYVRQQQPKK